MAVQLSGQVPEEKRNGLAGLADELIADELARVTAIVTIETVKIVHNVQKQETYPVVRFLHIEPMSGARVQEAQALMEAEYRERTGESELDFDFEDAEASE